MSSRAGKFSPLNGEWLCGGGGGGGEWLCGGGGWLVWTDAVRKTVPGSCCSSMLKMFVF